MEYTFTFRRLAVVSLSVFIQLAPLVLSAAVTPTSKPYFQLPAVVVRAGQRVPQPWQKVISGEQGRKMAGASGDVVRAVAALPGVGTPNDFLASMLVRGSGENDNLVLWDGFRVAYPFHFAGLESVFPAGLVDEAALLPGGFDARYGDVQGGVLELSVPAAVEGISGEVVTSLVQTGGIFRWAGEQVEVSASYRRGWLDWVIDPGPSLTGFPRWQDYFGRISMGPAHARWTLLAFGSEDSLGVRAARDEFLINPSLAGDLEWMTSFHTTGVRLDLGYPGSWQHKIQASSSARRDFFKGGADVSLDQRPQSWSLRAESNLEMHGVPPLNHQLNVGAEWLRTDTRLDGFFARLPVELGSSVDYLALDVVDINATGQKTLFSAWLQDRWQAMDFVFIGVGARFDHLAPAGEWHVSPRVYIETLPWFGGKLTGSVGDYFQTPSDLETVPGWTAAPSRGSLTRALVAGIEQTIGSQVLGVEVFRKDFERRLPRTVIDFGGNSKQAEFNAASVGVANGVEVMLKLEPLEQLSGWISYAWSSSKRQLPGQPSYPADFHQPHVFNLVLMWAPHRRWELSWRHRAASGIPYTPVASRTFDLAKNRWNPVFGPPNSARLEAYKRSDARAQFTVIDSIWTLRVFAEVFNVGDHANVTSASYLQDYSDIERLQQFPRFYYGGIEVIF